MKRLNKTAFISICINIILIVVVLAWIVDKYIVNHDIEESRDRTILLHFDQKDLKELNDLVTRFKEGKGKYIMLIPPIVDGGYWIHDVYSNGRVIEWSIDNTRDGMSGSSKGVKTYSCQSIERVETEELYTIYLSECEGFNADEKLPVFSILKETL